MVEIFERVDKNKDGKISWDKSAEAIRVFSPKIISEEIDKVFIVLVVDGDGQIDDVEFTSCLMEECVAIVQAVDKESDSFINFEEFKIMISSNKESF
ncbi:putative EF-hand domain pair protein CML [Arabidopsis thaliana]